MNSTSLVYAVLIVVFIVVISLIFFNIRARKQHLASDSRQEQAFKNWLKNNGYVPNHFHFFRGTGIAFSNGDGRLALFNNDASAFHRKDNLGGITTHEEVTGRMVAAAPGVVRQVNTTLYVLDISPKNVGEPSSKVMFPDSVQRNAWEARLQGSMKANAG